MRSKDMRKAEVLLSGSLPDQHDFFHLLDFKSTLNKTLMGRSEADRIKHIGFLFL
jgi:hypothetical protein